MRMGGVWVILALVVGGCFAQSGVQLNYGTYLFLDDLLLQNYKGAFFEQHAPVKTGAIITPDNDWETGIYFYTSAVQVSDIDYRIYYTCLGLDNYRTQTINLCMATSSNGINWDKPSLGVIGYGVNNDTNNNIVFAVPLGGWPNTVWIDLKPGTPESEKFKLTYDDPDRLLRVASSPDGKLLDHLVFPSPFFPFPISFFLSSFPLFSSSLPYLICHYLYGIKWSWLASPGIANQFADTQTVVLYDSNLQDYVAYGRRDEDNGRDDVCPGNYVSYRNIARSVSSTNVSQFGPAIQVFSWDNLDPPCVDPYNPAAVLYPSDPIITPYNTPSNQPGGTIPNTYLLFPAFTFHLTNVTVPFVNPYTLLYEHNDNLLDIHFIFSHNGVNFSYVTKEPFIGRGIGMRNITSGMFNSPNADWDSGFVFMTRGMFPTPGNPNTLSLYYYGTQMTHGTAAYITNANITYALKGLGRAEIRRDGFISLTTEYNLPMPQASIITKTLILPPASQCSGQLQLQLNVETSISGDIVVEILDSKGNPIPGFSSAECVSIKGNFVRVPVMWSSGRKYYSDLRDIAEAGKEISFSFVASHTKFYAMEFICVD